MLTHCGTPEIATDRLILRAFQMDDAQSALLNWASDEYVQRMYSEPVYETIDAAKGLIAGYIEKYAQPYYYRWAVIEKKSGECIGQIAIYLVVDRDHFCEIEYCIGSAFQRKGYCSEAVIAVRDFAFEHIHIHKMQVCHKAGNIASKRVIEKCGFRYDGTLRDYFYMDGQYVDRLFYSMVEDEWVACRGDL